MMVFVYVCLEVVDFSVMFTCLDFVKPIRYGVGVGLLRVVPSFASWYVISFPEIPMCALTFCIVMLYLVHRIWWTMAEK